MAIIALLWLGSPDLSPRDLYANGVHAMEMGHPDEALKLFERASTQAPDWPLPVLEEGVASLALGNLPAARQALEAATRLAPTNARAFYQLGLACKQANDPNAAVAALQQTVALRPRWLDAWIALAEVQETIGVGDAIVTYEHILSIDPANAAATGRLAALYEREGNTARAEACWQAIVRAHPSAAYYYYQMGQFYQRIGAPVKAKQAFGRAAALDPRPQRKMRRLK